MKISMRQSLFKRLAFIHALALIATWLITLGWMAHEATRFGVGDFDLTLRVIPESIVRYADRGYSREKLADIAAALEDTNIRSTSQELKPGQTYAYLLQIWDGAGNLIYRSPQAPASPLLKAPLGFSWTWINNESWRVLTLTSKDGSIHILGAESLTSRHQIMAGFAESLLSSLYWVLPIGILITWLGTRGGLRPLRQLASEIARRSPKDLGEIHCEPRMQETGPLVDSMNQLFQRLKHALESQQRFLGDAAHELRTPLAVIGAQAHVLVSARSREEAAEAQQELELGLERASHLANRLLTVARLDSDSFAPKILPVTLEPEVRQWLASANDQAESKEIEMSFESDHDHVIPTDPVCLRHAFDNLIENAILYGNKGGKILVTVESQRAGIVLRIADDGPGIPQADRDRLFQRFQRGTGVKTPGNGLGLAIVKRTMEILGGSVQPTDGLDGRGIGFDLWLPR